MTRNAHDVGRERAAAVVREQWRRLAEAAKRAGMTELAAIAEKHATPPDAPKEGSS